MLTKIRGIYKNNLIVRIVFQALIVLLVFFSVRYWKSLDNIEGQAPIIRATTLSGDEFDLKKHKNTPLLVHFWATWCPVCEMENSNIESVSEDYRVITVASWSESAKEVSGYLRNQALDIPVITDEDGEWAKLYGVKAVPTSFFIDADGAIRFIETGYTTELGLRLRLWWLEP